MTQIGGLSLFGWLCLLLVVCLLAAVRINGENLSERITRVLQAALKGDQ